MKRPHLVHFLAIETKDSLNVRAFATYLTQKPGPFWDPRFLVQISPLNSIGLLRSYRFRFQFIGQDSQKNVIFSKTMESDPFGVFTFKIPLIAGGQRAQRLTVYDIGTYPGLELHVGTYLPLILESPKKIVITDFDRTLVETKYSTSAEIYRSLTEPLSSYPAVPASVTLLKDYITRDYHPFVVSASPHFYEDAIRDWLYQHEIFTAGIFLKDYRSFFSPRYGMLRPKDVHAQGLHKLGRLLDIILMTGAPDEVALLGDTFESDLIIYLAFASILHNEYPPWFIWNELKREEPFRLVGRQHSHLLNKLYSVSNILRDAKVKPRLNIHIRAKNREEIEHTEMTMDFLAKKLPLVNFYLP
jgi:hypothetical protein